MTYDGGPYWPREFDEDYENVEIPGPAPVCTCGTEMVFTPGQMATRDEPALPDEWTCFICGESRPAGGNGNA